MNFDWLAFCDSNHVDYKVTGAQQISINCPLCSGDDPSKHMSINLEGRGWRCWRHPYEHFGRKPTKLVAAILHIPLSRAAEIAGDNTFMPTNFLERVKLAVQPVERVPPKSPKLPAEFKPITDSIACRPYVNYLLRRGYSKPEIYRFKHIYYCARGPYHGRIIFTVHQNKQLMTWTGRTVSPNAGLRYRTLSQDRDKAKRDGHDPACGPITNYLLWYDELMRDGDTIVLCEGPFDALRVRSLGRRDGIVATCLFTTSISPEQVELLHMMLPLYQRRILLLDKGTMVIALRYARLLADLDVRSVTLPSDIKDPGEIQTTKQLLSVLEVVR